MNEAEQELYEALVTICQTSGFLLLEELPTDLPDQPFVYLGDSKELPKPTKSAILGEIELIMHVYGAVRYLNDNKFLQLKERFYGRQPVT